MTQNYLKGNSSAVDVRRMVPLKLTSCLYGMREAMASKEPADKQKQGGCQCVCPGCRNSINSWRT